jgi:hypothetical protein
MIQSDAGERLLKYTNTASQAKVFHRTVQNYILSLIYLYSMYSVLVTLRRLNQTQLEIPIGKYGL